MKDDLFKRLPVFLIHTDREKRKHEADHAQGGNVRPNMRPAEKIKRDSHGPGQCKADKLPFCEIQGNFVLYPAKVFRDRYIGHVSAPFCPMNGAAHRKRPPTMDGPLMGAEYRFCEAPGFEQGEAEQQRVTGTAPYRPVNVAAAYGNGLHQYGVNSYTHHD